MALEEGNGGQLHEALRMEKIDAAIIRSHRAAPTELILEVLLEERMVIALPASHPLAKTKSKGKDRGLPLKALADETFVVYTQQFWPGLYEPIVAACSAAGFSPKVGQLTPRVLSAVNLVAAGLGVTIVPASLERLHMDGLAFRTIAGRPQILAPLNLVFRRGEASAVVRRFIELARRTAGSFRDDTTRGR